MIWAIMQGSALGFKVKKTPFDGLRGMALKYHWRYTKHQLAKRIMRDCSIVCVDAHQEFGRRGKNGINYDFE